MKGRSSREKRREKEANGDNSPSNLLTSSAPVPVHHIKNCKWRELIIGSVPHTAIRQLRRITAGHVVFQWISQ